MSLGSIYLAALIFIYKARDLTVLKAQTIDAYRTRSGTVDVSSISTSRYCVESRRVVFMAFQAHLYIYVI